MKILVVDDNDFSIEMIEEMLEAFDVEIIAAKDGGEAIAMFGASKEREIGLILMDIIMPGMKGNEVAAAIRQLDRPDAATVPIYAVTAIGGHNAETVLDESGIDGIFRKPLDPKALGDLVNSLSQK